MASVHVLVGTKKGAWVYTADEARREWTLSPPMMPGWTINHLAVDTRRDTPRLLAGGAHWAWGPMVARSDDGGVTWTERSPGIAFEAERGVSVGSVWQVQPRSRLGARRGVRRHAACGHVSQHRLGRDVESRR